MTQEEFIKHAIENPADLDALFAHIRQNSIKQHRFDFDYSLSEGKMAEELVNNIFTGQKKIEVKLDGKVSQTGNLAIEYGQKFGSKFKPTGITVSEADWYMLVFGGELFNKELFVGIATKRLIKVLNAFGKTHPASNLKGNSDFLLVPKNALLSSDKEL